MTPSCAFTSLVGQIVDLKHGGTLLSDDLYRSVLKLAFHSWCLSEPETLAPALRQLGVFCDWREFKWANELLDAGTQPDELYLEVHRINEERERLFRGPEFNETVAEIADSLATGQESQRRLLQHLRDGETLMGFDQAVMDNLNETLGPWDDAAVPGSLLEILPAEVLFPLRDHERSTPYDHRLHLLVRELASRLGKTGRCHDEVIKHCGDLLACLYYDNDEAAAGTLFLEQMTLLADEYIRIKPSDIIGRCWRGELACWAGDEDLALEYAQRVWDQARSGSPGHGPSGYDVLRSYGKLGRHLESREVGQSSFAAAHTLENSRVHGSTGISPWHGRSCAERSSKESGIPPAVLDDGPTGHGFTVPNRMMLLTHAGPGWPSMSRDTIRAKPTTRIGITRSRACRRDRSGPRTQRDRCDPRRSGLQERPE